MWVIIVEKMRVVLFPIFNTYPSSFFSAARGVIPESFVPRLKKTVTYIVMAVIINSKNAVLMMQEAKSICNGAWYLPAGKVEEGETLEEAVKREVLEETGLEMAPTTLLAVETAR